MSGPLQTCDVTFVQVAKAQTTPVDEQENSRAASESGAGLSQEAVDHAKELARRGLWNGTIAQLVVSTIRTYEEWRDYEIKHGKVMRPEDKKELSQSGSGELENVPSESELYTEVLLASKSGRQHVSRNAY